ncbi:thiamine biosynthesis-like protein [Angomonas deanei]|nr:thiamine biosynthesis-like protein [Angomonas deanei]|eukprot:EPY28151.1 thiamine biosynthesis-like protein [Angomonas deanei]
MCGISPTSAWRTWRSWRRRCVSPGRRWYCSDKESYALQVKTGASTTEGVNYGCLQNIRNKGQYYFGIRHGKPPVEPITLILTVADIYLKSAIHQKRYFKLLCNNISRVLDNPRVHRNGNTMIEVRKDVPTEEQIHLLSLIPGVAKIYKAAEGENSGDPRGDLIMTGTGGMPLTPEQLALTLISGGIDSPVAAYRIMTRGCTVHGIHFLNSTNDTASVMEKNRRIADKLSLIQGRFQMHYVDISKLQSQIVANVPNNNRTLIYKWCMLALAASFDESHFIVTGDSIGQVASQTVENISTLYPTINKAVISPLVGMTKNYIIDEARRIDTYRYSIQEGADCCQYMMCKTGANLAMGRRTLEACVRRIKLSELPVLTETHFNGSLVSSENSVFLPNISVRENRIAPGAPSTRKQKEGADQGAEAAAAKEDAAADEEVPVYFDAAAGTLMPHSVKQAVMNAPEGNPNSMHASGRDARMAVEKVRSEIAAVLRVPAKDIIFTAGGTESNNIALHGYHVVRDAWSHASTSEGAEVPEGATVVHVVDLVNHETGSIAPTLKRPEGGRLHVDASQALTKIDFSKIDMSQVDSMTVTAHKINGPVGVGALYLRDLKCNKLFSGGSQEKGIRPGTENVPAIVGFGAALRLDRSNSAYREVEQYLVEELTKLNFDINRRGETSGYIVHATLPEGYDNTDFVTVLSTKYNVEIGTGSACKTGEENTTVYDTLGKTPAPKRSVRFSWDAFATLDDVEKVVNAVKRALTDLKKK